MTTFQATYSPDDDKLRLYATTRLDDELYQRVKKAGFRWAPHQELFFAYWSPAAEDILIELAGEVEDEDKTLTERAEERADRFEDYQEKRAKDAERAEKGVSAIADGIPFGQPILVGHHSERRARKDAEKIENGMKKVIKMWETSKYWAARAEGALAHAKYKERPEVRARRIKKILADIKRCKASYIGKGPAFMAHRWDSKGDDAPELHVMCGQGRAAHPVPVVNLPGIEAGYKRYIQHLENRLVYEYAMLNEQGAIDLVTKKPRPAVLPICNYRQEEIVVEVPYSRDPLVLKQLEMTTDEYKALGEDRRYCVKVENSHRVRVGVVHKPGVPYYQTPRSAIFLTDSKVHEKPAPVEKAKKPDRIPQAYTPREPDPIEEKIQAMKQSLEGGVKVVSAPQLFVTPAGLADRVIEAADIQDRNRVLEPSAGTGNLIKAIPKEKLADVTAIDINPHLLDNVRERFQPVFCMQADFLKVKPEELGKFDRIVMNPPFAKQEDIEHVTHAIQFLRAEGKLVAIMSAGVLFRQDRKASDFRAMIEGMGGVIEELPDDSFKDSGTGVRTVLVEVCS